MGKPTGFLEFERKDGAVVPENERIKNFNEFHSRLSLEEQRKQAARCMECGVPFCQAGVKISGMISGCPLNNLVPEVNDLVYRGNFAEAYRRLSITHCFPEFTSRVCPALCEHACTCGLHQEPVSTKENEKAIIEYAFSNGLVEEPVPKVRTGKKVAVIGSGPSGLSAALMLNRRGHLVTVFERSDRVGGLLRYGIPNMKLDKAIIDRRIALMEKAGITFNVNTNIGKDISGEEILKEYDAVVLACGASHPRDINAPGRDAEGIYFAVDFLKTVTKRLLDSGYKGITNKKGGKTAEIPEKKSDTSGYNRTTGEQGAAGYPEEKNGLQIGYEERIEADYNEYPYDLAEGKDVIVIGGGDTGNDCVGTCIRLHAKSVTQLEMMPEPPKERLESNPWPEWPRVLKVDYGQEEAIDQFGSDPRIYKTTVKEFKKDENGKLKSVILVSLESKKDEKTGRMSMVPVEGTEKEVPAQLVLIAAGFLGSESYVTESFGVEVDGRTNVKTDADKHMAIDQRDGSAVESAGKNQKALNRKSKIFAAGDMHIGQSLVVRAIAEGKAAAKEVDEYLMGYSNL